MLAKLYNRAKICLNCAVMNVYFPAGYSPIKITLVYVQLSVYIFMIFLMNVFN